MKTPALAILLAITAPPGLAQQRADVPTMEADGSAVAPHAAGPTTLAYLSQFPEEFVGSTATLDGVWVMKCERVNNAEASGMNIPGDSYRITLYDPKQAGQAAHFWFFANDEAMGRALLADRNLGASTLARVSVRVNRPIRVGATRPSYSATVLGIEWLDRNGAVLASVP